MVFLQALAWKTSGFHIRYRFKEYRGGPQVDHLSSVLTYLIYPRNTEKCMEITDGTLNDKSFNASGSEILIKENVSCNVDIPSLLPSLFK